MDEHETQPYNLTQSDFKRIQEILLFWFGSPEEPSFGTPKPFWFSGTVQEDKKMRQLFTTDYEKARKGGYDQWLDIPEGTLAFILLTDQIPRNIFRQTPQAFATDALALAVAKMGVDKKFDQTLSPVYRKFFYMPFMHAEDEEAQAQSLVFFKKLNDLGSIEFAQKHYDIIKRFKRFPHRNATLERLSTPEEVTFLRQAGSSF